MVASSIAVVAAPEARLCSRLSLVVVMMVMWRMVMVMMMMWRRRMVMMVMVIVSISTWRGEQLQQPQQPRLPHRQAVLRPSQPRPRPH